MGYNLGGCIKKMQNLCVELHPLEEGDTIVDLFIYNLVMTNDQVIDSLKEELGQAQELLITLNMNLRTGL